VTEPKVPSSNGRQLVAVAAVCDTLLAIFLLLIGILGPTHSGPTWVAPAVSLPILAVVVVMFLWFAAVCWQQLPDPEGHHAALTIAALLAGAAAIILTFTLLYWKTAQLGGPQAFYDAVGTMTGGPEPPILRNAVGLVVTGQELIDLIFLGGVVTVVLGRAFP
jgi:hypothetical protein